MLGQLMFLTLLAFTSKVGLFEEEGLNGPITRLKSFVIKEQSKDQRAEAQSPSPDISAAVLLGLNEFFLYLPSWKPNNNKLFIESNKLLPANLKRLGKIDVEVITALELKKRYSGQAEEPKWLRVEVTTTKDFLGKVDHYVMVRYETLANAPGRGSRVLTSIQFLCLLEEKPVRLYPWSVGPW